MMRKRIAISLGGLLALGLVAVSCHLGGPTLWTRLAVNQKFNLNAVLDLAKTAVMRDDVQNLLMFLFILVIGTLLIRGLRPGDWPP